MIRSAGPALARPAAGSSSSDPPEPVRGSHRGSLPRSGGISASRSRSRRRRWPSSSRPGSQNEEHRRHARPLDRRLRRSGQLHVHALPLRKRATRAYFSSPETDRILEEARGEARPAAREALYRKFEHALLDPAIVVPLFHDVDYRIAEPPGPRPPAAQHRSLRELCRAREGGERGGDGSFARRPDGRRDPPRARSRASSGTSIRPSARPWSTAKWCPASSRPLTRALEGTRIVPWIASEVLTENDGQRYRFRLRPGVRFHDGRRLTARDVRFSWERLLMTETVNRWLLSPIRGARRVIAGETTDLEGFHIVSPNEFFIELEKPVAFFPAVLSYAPTAILPEGTGAVDANVEQGARPSGPVPSDLSPSTPAGGSSSSATRRTGGRGTRVPTESSSASASHPRRSVTSSSPEGSRSLSICFPPTPRRSGTIPVSPPGIGRTRGSRPIT